MSAGSWSVLVAVVAICGGVMYLLVRAEREYERANSEAPTQIPWTVGRSRDAPVNTLSVVGAHRIMQRRNCDREGCPRKAVAYRVLVEARHIRPDSGRTY